MSLMQGVGFLCGLFFVSVCGVLTIAILRWVEPCCVAASRGFSGRFGRRSEVIFNVRAGTAGRD